MFNVSKFQTKLDPRNLFNCEKELINNRVYEFVKLKFLQAKFYFNDFTYIK